MALMAADVVATKVPEEVIAKVDTADLIIVARTKDLKETTRRKNAKISTWATASTVISAPMLMVIKI